MCLVLQLLSGIWELDVIGVVRSTSTRQLIVKEVIDSEDPEWMTSLQAGKEEF